ncbi:FHA domain-containing protein [Pseudarthrobacter phenanthrenivorans]|uniref:FHA domain-containing protein n=1 Tax=Pseudarthrobacter phenanthrenivorans TaxID=361575 RepID=A0A3B0FY63_PSEPS|nr:FHA domain-containing protein [Pseudarthrobacter phenanthrenivorans]RKO24850.1 FHA domain-containing protein [Pseudarthrobacter phenanthrenivorans]
MAGTSYVPGTWLGILRSRTAVLLGPDTPPVMARAVWDLLASKPQVHEVLHALTSSSGGSLTKIPSFGILDFSGTLRVFLRGDLDLAVELPDGLVELDGRDVTTWNERRFALAGSCRLTVPGAGPGDRPELPLGEGTVLLQSLSIALAPGLQELQPAQPAPAAVPVNSAGIADIHPAEPANADVQDTTIAPEQEASAETVLGLPDDDTHLDGAAPAQDPSVTGGRDATGQGTAGQDTAGQGTAGQDTAGQGGNDQTTSYDHLWERTVMRSIEDAAVRDETETDQALIPGAIRAVQGGVQLPIAAPDDTSAPVDADAPAGTEEEEAAPAAASAPQPAAPVRPAAVLIDSVPWRTGTGTTPVAGTTPGAGTVRGAGTTPGEDPATPQAPAPASPPNTAGPAAGTAADRQHPAFTAFDGDHDGQTVLKSNVGTAGGHSASVAADDAAGGPTVLARVCSQGHANPPTRAQCAGCGAALLPDAVQVPRPRLGRVRVSTGELLDLDQSLVIGRQPSVSRVQGGSMPRLVQVPSPEGDISRSHVEVRLEGWHVMLCDLKATNGTVLVREGQPPRRLAQNEMAILLDGDIAELGDNISLRFEEIP